MLDLWLSGILVVSDDCGKTLGGETMWIDVASDFTWFDLLAIRLDCFGVDVGSTAFSVVSCANVTAVLALSWNSGWICIQVHVD